MVTFSRDRSAGAASTSTPGSSARDFSGRGRLDPRRLWRRVRTQAWLLTRPSRIGRFLGFALQRFAGDDGPRMAASLSYASLLALVPLLAIMLAIISAFPVFQGVEERIVGLFLDDALPPMDAEVSNRIREFVRNATSMTGPGILGLAVTAVLLLANINDAFNTIWRVREVRPWPVRLLVYWALLTVGPLLVAASLSVSSLLVAGTRGAELTALADWLIPPWAVSVLVGAVGFALIFLVVPNRRIRPVHALAGGLASSALFEVLKFAFGLYLAYVPGYQVVYGAMAALPLFLIWLYLSWGAVLIGAEVCAALPEWGAHQRRAGPPWAGERLALALSLLLRAREAQKAGAPLARRDLVQGLPATPGEIDGVLLPLRRHRLLERTAQGHWLLACDPAAVALDDVLDALDLAPDPGEGWPPLVSRLVKAWAADSLARRHVTLARLLESEGR